MAYGRQNRSNTCSRSSPGGARTPRGPTPGGTGCNSTYPDPSQPRPSPTRPGPCTHPGAGAAPAGRHLDRQLPRQPRRPLMAAPLMVREELADQWACRKAAGALRAREGPALWPLPARPGARAGVGPTASRSPSRGSTTSMRGRRRRADEPLPAILLKPGPATMRDCRWTRRSTPHHGGGLSSAAMPSTTV